VSPAKASGQGRRELVRGKALVPTHEDSRQERERERGESGSASGVPGSPVGAPPGHNGHVQSQAQSQLAREGRTSVLAPPDQGVRQRPHGGVPWEA